MRFSIIIPTCDRNDLLRKCLINLRKENQSYKEDFEVIVSDDSRDNKAKDLILQEFPWVTWIEGPKVGPAANRNNGAKLASGEWLVFTDDDCLPQSNWLLSYENAIQLNISSRVFEGKTIADRERLRFDEIAPINLTGNNLWSCNFTIIKSLFIQLNGFDEGFPYAAMEDVDFQCRVIIETDIIFIPDALIVHPWRRVKPFASMKKHLLSHRYILNKNIKKRNLNYRLVRTKIFISAMYYNFLLLAKFSMRGWQVFVEDCILNFCMIFI